MTLIRTEIVSRIKILAVRAEEVAGWTTADYFEEAFNLAKDLERLANEIENDIYA